MHTDNFYFNISERRLYLRVLDIGFTILGLYVLNVYFNFDYFDFSSQSGALWISTLIIYLLVFGEIFEMYDLKVASDKYLTLRSTVITVFFATLFYVFTPVISPLLPTNRLQLAYFSLTMLFSILLNRLFYIQLIFSPRFLKNILLIADSSQLNSLVAAIQNKSANRIVAVVSDAAMANNDKIAFIAVSDANLEEIVKEEGINEIVISSNNLQFITPELNNQLILLFEKGMAIRSSDNFIEDETHRISETKLTTNFYNHFTFSKSHQNNLYLAFRRVLDVFFSLIGILFFLFLIPFVFVGNLFANKGKLLYTQKRIGKRGKKFRIIKFRTMVSNAEENGAEWAQKNDSRVTAFGKMLRKARVDEIPQFINVLKGDMSLIGPRPERPEFVTMLEKELPFYAIRHVVKPGLTGWAQVMYPYAHSVDDQHKKLMYDLYYIKERNLLMDLKIVIKTISTILFFRGT
ncbi:MAG: exopolysaccharide biosynthesis polyprenyl glycosylphosphotransferase [Lutibacter sp.]|nr:exopolysaccharide biosynthesis polyprenyl glycosylphosphotransferase [Lutibacter sp.]MDT8417727.1 exopolysaccharide biosynthesis polyprenyl glycosylphosphotransferase [Lutibacter sp.]